MPTARIVLSLLASMVCSVASLGCSEPRAAIEVKLDGKPIYHCDDASMDELSPKQGGWAFKCRDGSSVYFIYETASTPAKGTIQDISIHPAEGSEPPSMVAIADERTLDCPAVLAERGGEPFATRWLGGVEAGTTSFAVARPCGMLDVVITRH